MCEAASRREVIAKWGTGPRRAGASMKETSAGADTRSSCRCLLAR